MTKWQGIKVVASVYVLIGIGISFYGIKKLKNKVRGKNGRVREKDSYMPTNFKAVNR